MKTSMFCIFDMVANQFGFPFPAVNSGSAVRQFQAEQSRPSDLPMHTHPSDFRLFYIGVFDSDVGTFELLPQPEFLYQGAVPSSSPAQG